MLAASDTSKLAAQKRNFLNSANADGSGGQHSTGVRWWTVYCVWGRGVSPIPDPRRLRADDDYRLEVEDLLEDFAVWLAVCRPSGRQISHTSIKKYISSVRSWYGRFYRAQLGVGSRASRIRDILRGYAREVPQPPPLERHGCTPLDLARGMAWAYADGSAASQMWRAALTFGMVGLCRGCEFALDGRESFDTSQHMMPADVAFFEHDGVRHASARMRKRKDLRVLRGKQARVLIAGGGSYFDAAAELERWMECRRGMGLPANGPLFCHSDGRAITVAEVRAEVRRVMMAAGQPPEKFGAHSLRIGGATAALAAGVPPQLIRLMGRWSSDVYEIYCRISAQSALRVGAAIGSAAVTPLDARFETEALELLPYETEQLFRAADIRHDADDDEDEA